MKTLIATLVATAVSAIFIAPAGAAPVDKNAHRAAMDKAALDYRNAKTKCDARSGKAEDTCEDEAKLAQARAELDAYTKYDTTGGNLRDARAKVIRAEHELAQTQCDATDADSTARCKATAGSIRDAALARLDDRDDDAAAGAGSPLVARIDTLDPKKAAAVAQCEQASGDARTACVVDDRGQVRTAARSVAADSTITTKVKAGLVADPTLKGMDISVDTEGGVVMLGGFVASKAEAEKAVGVAKGVDGVSSVKSKIKVK